LRLYPPEIRQRFDQIMQGAPPLRLFRVMAGRAGPEKSFAPEACAIDAARFPAAAA